jgi:molybdopterin molybdotransferase
MITVSEAEAIILAQAREYGTEHLPFDQALGRVLAEDLRADRDLPPYNRVAMDGIAINYAAYEEGNRTFKIWATQAAGDQPVELASIYNCIEIMTGAALPASADTIIRYEDVTIEDGAATLQTEDIRKGQNIHPQGKDRKKGETVAPAKQVITSALISMAAAVGATKLEVKKLPRAAVISTGDELVDVGDIPSPHQIRRSNSYAIKAALQTYALQVDLLHLPDNLQHMRNQLKECLELYDVLILSGGISMGKFDYVPQVLEELAVEKLFHKVQQRPGKPFWFGVHAAGAVVFALPGNPVSTYMCLHRYFVPWLKASLGIGSTAGIYGILGEDVAFNPSQQYFLQVKVEMEEKGQVVAIPLSGNGSGDFANLVEADAFLELPSTKTIFKAGEVYRLWPFKQIFFS